MSKFLHKLAEELRTREQYLEEHSANPIFEADGGASFKQDYEALLAELKDFSDKVKKATETGEDYDEHFEKEIADANTRLQVKIETWAKGLSSK